MRCSVTFLLFLFSSVSLAVPVKWTLQDVYLDNGAQVTGSFIYDADVLVNSCAIPGEVFPTCSVSVPDAYSDFEFEILQTNNTTISFTEGNSSVYYWDPWTDVILTDEDSLEVQCSDCDPSFSGVDFYLGFVFYPGALTNAGGVVPLYDEAPVGFQATNGWRVEVNGEPVGYSQIVSGSVVGVPIPAAVWLFGSGLGFLGWFRRRQTA